MHISILGLRATTALFLRNSVSVVNTETESKEVLYRSALWNFVGVVLFLDVVYTLAVEEIYFHSHILSAGFILPEDVATTTIMGVHPLYRSS